MAEPEPAPWPGLPFVGCLQLACGAFADGRSDVEVAHRVTQAVASVPWPSLSPAEFFIARGILLSFLIRLSNHRRHPFADIATPLLERLAAADAADVVPIVTHALRPGTAEDPGQPVLASARDWRVRHALALVATSFHRTIRVSDLARNVGLSKWHLERLTKRVTGRSLRVHLAQARMTSATRLLEERRASVKEVAARVGYGNPDSFRRDFKRQYGMTPHAWQAARPWS